jgi:hypothetical protein
MDALYQQSWGFLVSLNSKLGLHFILESKRDHQQLIHPSDQWKKKKKTFLRVLYVRTETLRVIYLNNKTIVMYFLC